MPSSVAKTAKLWGGGVRGGKRARGGEGRELEGVRGEEGAMHEGGLGHGVKAEEGGGAGGGGSALKSTELTNPLSQCIPSSVFLFM
jgi:hypothetical protein